MGIKKQRIITSSAIIFLLSFALILFIVLKRTIAFYLLGSIDATVILAVLVWTFLHEFFVRKRRIGAKEVNVLTIIATVSLLIVVILLCVRVSYSTTFYVFAALDVSAFLSYGFMVILQQLVAWQRRRRETTKLISEEEGVQLEYSFIREAAGLPRKIRYEELKAATQNFQIPIGRGGSGSVFKGILSDGSPVAVKRISGELRGDKEFRSEITAILSVQHISLVRILGYCLVPGSHRFLVYDFFEHGSLESWIFPKSGGENCLNWPLRYQVAIDVAKALSYLHHHCRQRILHLDIKPENILLDDNFRAHVTDFGISRLMGVDESSAVTTVRGTRGYLAPEWFLAGGISEKSDVYSYGMVLLELIGGRRNANFIDEGNISQRRWSYFPKNASEKMREGNLMELLDKRLLSSGDVKEEDVKTLVYVALWCIQETPELRPSMELVVAMLQKYVAVNMPPETKMFLVDPPLPNYSGSTISQYTSTADLGRPLMSTHSFPSQITSEGSKRCSDFHKTCKTII